MYKPPSSTANQSEKANSVVIYRPGPWPDPAGILGPAPYGAPPGNGPGYVLPRKGDANPEICVNYRCGQPCTFNCTPLLPCAGVCGCVGTGCLGGGTCVGQGC